MNSPPLSSSKKNRKKKKKKAKSSAGANVDAGVDKMQNGYGDSCTTCTCASGSRDGSSSESSFRRCSECNKDARSSPQVVQCTCPSCTASRELSHVSVGGETDMSSTQSYWMEIRHVVRNIYRSTNSDNKPILNTDKMKNIVKRLCRGDPHQFFQRLETLAREYLLEVKVRLLEQLSLGFNSPQLAISFIEMLLDEYFTLADALPYLHQLLQPLEDSRYVDNLKLTVDLMNKNIFRELIFAESFMSSNLPLIIAQLRLASLSSDAHHRVMADKLNQQYSELDQEMEEIGHLWRAAKSDFAGFPPSIPIDQSTKAHIEEIRSDAESLKRMKQQQKQQSKSQDPPPPKPVTSKMVNQVVMPPTEEPKPFSACGLTNTQLCSKIKPLESVHLDSSGRTLKPSELSTILYHCMKPVGDADTVLDGDQVLQTYTLKLELSKLDLSNLSTEGHLSENDRYKDLGLSEEEMNDINLKLNALKAIGLDLQLEDLLDSGISLVEQNKAGMNGLQRHTNGTNHLPNGKVFEGMWKKNGGLVAAEDMNGITSSSRTLFDDLVLKLRMSKKLSKKEIEQYHLHGPEGIQFSCQDEAQLQVVRFSNVSTNGNCVGAFLGLEKEYEDPMDNELFNSIHHHEVVRVLQQQLEQCAHEKDSVEALKSRGLVTTGKLAASKCEKLEKASSLSSEKSSVEKESESSSSSGSGKAVVTSSNSSQPSDVDLSKLKPVIVPSNNPCQCATCVGARAAAATNCSHSETVMHSVHKIQLTPGHNFIALAQEKPTKPLRPGEAPKTHLLHYKLDSKDMQPSTSGSAGGVGGAGVVANGSDQLTCHNHSINHGDSGYEDDACSMESSKSSAQHSPDCDNCHHHNHHHHHHGHHGHHHHGHQHCGDASTTNQATTSTSSAATNSNNVDDMSSSSSSNSLKASTANSSTNTVVTGSSGTNASNNNGGSGRTYCRCCYCELFGHSGPPTAPTSHNYTKQRDKMRVKLEMKKQRDTGGHDHCSCSNANHSTSSAQTTTATDSKDDRSLDTLLEFINGPEEENHKISSRAAKRQRRKQRKQEHNQHNIEDDGDNKQSDSSSTGKQEGSKKNKSTKKTDDSETIEDQQHKEEGDLDSSDDETEKGRSQGGSDHSSDDLELAAEMMMHRSSSQEFKLVTSGSKQQEKSQGEKSANNEVHSNGITSNGASGAKTQTHNQKVQQEAQPQQSTVQKSRPTNPTSTTKPASDQYTTMTSRRQQQATPPSQQPAKENERVETGQKFYSSDYNSRAPQPPRQPTRDKDGVGRDSREARFHYAPNPNRIKQLPPRFQRMAQEQLANQQQQQQQQHSRSNRYNTAPGYSHSNSVPVSSQLPAQKRDNTNNTTSLDDVFMPKDDPVNASDGEMDEIDRELEEFKRFCYMNKPLENRPKVAVKVNLKDLTLKKP